MDDMYFTEVRVRLFFTLVRKLCATERNGLAEGLECESLKIKKVVVGNVPSQLVATVD